jgi:hypothetical protein
MKRSAFRSPRLFLRGLRHRAVTLIEAVLFIAIALGLIVGGLVFFRQASTARQTQETVRMAQAIVSEVRALFKRDRPDSQVELAEILIASGAVPSQYVHEDGDKLVSPWGGGSR